MRLLPNRAPVLAEVLGAYYSVRTGWDYGYGEDFDIDQRQPAFAAAKAKIKPIIHGGRVTGWTGKVSVEMRWQVRYVDGAAMGQSVASGTDLAVQRWPVELTGSEKAEVLARPEYRDRLRGD